jgi:hypothetical protein
MERDDGHLERIPKEIRQCLEDDTPSLAYKEKDLYFWDAFAAGLLRDRRDLHTLHYACLMTVLSIPNAILLFTRPDYFYYGAAIHLILFAAFGTKFVLMLHCVVHRKLFKTEVDYLNLWIPHVLGPFYGQTPGGFHLHHIMMHHFQGNGPADLSCTMFFQRDSLWDFMIYFGRFFFFVSFELWYYFVQRKLWGPALRLAIEWLQFGVWYMGLQSNAYRGPVLIVLMLPWLIMRFGMMSGNWAQHAFVDPDAPYDDFVTSITCIGTPYNKLAFNDGYHTAHHLAASKHWADLPQDLVIRLPAYIAAQAFVFKGVDFHGVFFMLMRHQYKELARHLVWLDGKERSEEEVIALLKKRLRRLSPEEARAAAERWTASKGLIIEPYTGVQSYEKLQE